MLDKELQALIDDRKHSLHKLVISTADAGLRYLFAMNGGAIIAVLAFIGSSNSHTNVNVEILTISLIIFFAAISMVGYVNLRRFHLFNNMLWTVRKNEHSLCQIARKNEHFDTDSDQSNYDESFRWALQKAFQEDQALIEKSERLKWIAYFSFVLFIIGGLLTSIAFF